MSLTRSISISTTKIVLSIVLSTAVFFYVPAGRDVSFAQDVFLGKVDANKTKNDFIKSGKTYYSSGKYEEAINEWEKVLLLDPGNKRVKKCIENAARKLEKEKRKTGLISIAAPPPEMSTKLTLDDCLQIAIKNNPQLKIAEKSIALAEYRIWEARRNLFPKISAIWEESSGRIQGKRYYGKKEYIEGEHNLPIGQGAETYYLMKQAELNWKVTKEEYKKSRNELILQVKKNFYSLVKSEENLRIQRELKKEVGRVFEMVKKGNANNVITKVELLNVTSQASQAGYQLASAESDKILAELILKHTMNVDDREPIAIERPNLEFQKVGIDYEDALRAAFANRPEMRINSFTVIYNNYEKDISKAKGWPKVVIMGNWGLAKEEFVAEDFNYAYGGDADRKMEQQWYTGFKVNMPFWGSTGEYMWTKEQWVPVVSAFHGTESNTKTVKATLFDKLVYFSDKLAAEIESDRAKQDFERIKQDITSEVREGCFNYDKSLILLGAASDKVKYQEKDLELITLKRGLDEVQDSNVVESMIKLAQERFGYIQAMIDCHTNIANINKVIGIEDYYKSETKEQKEVVKK